jgi:hypothetical protein
MTTAADIFQPLQLDQLRQVLIGLLQSMQDPITAWQSGRVRRTQLEYDALVLDDFLRVQLEAFFDNVNIETAATSWLPLDAEQLFGLAAGAPVPAQQLVTLTCANGFGPYTISAGRFFLAPPTGNRYYAITGGTVSFGSPLTVTVQAEGPDDPTRGLAYNDPPKTITALENPLLGVTLANTAPAFSGVTSTPSPALGLGVVTVTGTAPAAPTAYDFQIVTSGQNTTATFRWRANGGPWSAPVTMAATFTIPSTSVVVHFTNDAGGSNPSFRAGDVYSFTSPGSPIVRPATLAEAAAALIARCFARWPSLAPGPPPVEKHLKWAAAASALVKRAKAVPDSTYPGRLLITIAGAPGTGALSGGVVATVQTAIDQRESWGALPLVSAASVTTVTATGTVLVPHGQSAIVEANASPPWTAYVNGTDIGGVVELARVVALLMDAGAVDVTGLELNSVAADLVLGTSAVAQAADLSSLTFAEQP